VNLGQGVGFTLAEMKTFVDLHQPSSQSPEALADFLQEKVTQIDAQIAQLTGIRAALLTLSVSDYNWNIEEDCPIVQLLEGINVAVKTDARSQA
jgi:DNA-binding transcriptional MerR regulator